VQSPQFENVTPLIPAGPDLQSALDLYQRMGFSIEWHDGNGAGIKRGSVHFNLVRNDNREWASNASFSIAVSDLRSLYEEFRNLPATVGPLETKPWGRVEFHLIIPPGVCLQFYEVESRL